MTYILYYCIIRFVSIVNININAIQIKLLLNEVREKKRILLC